MKKTVFIISLILALSTMYAQQLEVGPSIGYGFVNIADSNSKEDKAVIGDALWDFNYGLNAVYYFKNPKERLTGRVGLLYRKSNRGSVSETDSDNKFEFAAHTFGVFGGIAGNLGDGYIMYLDIGFGRNSLDDSDYYKGNLAQTVAFESLKDDLVINSSETVFIYAIGLEKEIVANKLKVFLEVNGDAAISNLNKSFFGSYKTQAVAFGTGLRYIIDVKKKEK